jgi:predicted HAD superfamily Cof-like phosphohydrolase
MTSALRGQVREFHTTMGQPVAERPSVPHEDRVRLRAALIAEECLETLAAMLAIREEAMAYLQSVVKVTIANSHVRVDMVELADGMADLDYVVEGTRLEFGIDGDPIAAAVHAANMAKATGPVAANGKRLKPPGWTPPDIEGELRRQGWR